MGTLLGHLIPGTFFIAISLWWMVSIFKRYFKYKLNPKALRYKNTATFSSQRWRQYPLEAILKLVASITGIIGETITGFDDNWRFVNLMPNGQHIAMFLFYAINAFADLAKFYKVPHLPSQIDYISAIIAAGRECYLFANHLHGRSSLDIKLHTTLVIVIVFCIISITLEMVADKHDVRLGLFRSCCYLWQGTWFYQVGFVLYPPNGFPIWDQSNMMSNMLMDLMFMGHLIFVIFVSTITGVGIYAAKKKEYVKKSIKATSVAYNKLDCDSDVDHDNTNFLV